MKKAALSYTASRGPVAPQKSVTPEKRVEKGEQCYPATPEQESLYEDMSMPPEKRRRLIEEATAPKRG